MAASKSNFEIKWYNSLRGRLFLIFSTLVLFFSVFIFWFFPAQLKKGSLESVKEKVNTLSEFIAYSVAPSLYFVDPESAEETIEAARQSDKISYLIIEDLKGLVFASFGDEIAHQVAYRSQSSIAIREAEELMVIGKPVKVSGEVVGMIYMGHSLNQVYSEIAATRKWIAGLCMIFCVLGLGFVFWATGITTRNLKKIVQVVNQADDDNLAMRAEVKTSDEVGMLAQRFNEMLARLDHSVKAQKIREIQYLRLAENMNEGLMRINPNGKILFANPRLLEMFEVDGLRNLKIKIETVLSQNKQANDLTATLGANDSDQLELEVRSPNKGILWTLLSYSTFTSHDEDQESEIICLFTDITKLKKTESDLIYKNRELDTFVYKASHDLKAPLSSLRGLVDIAKMELEGPSAEQYLGLIDRVVGKMDDVLLGLLEVTWIKQGAMEFAEIELRDVINSIISSITHAKGFETTEIILEIPPAFRMVSDLKLLNSVMQNLIHNAIKYHRESGDDKWVKVSARTTATHHVLSVKDNGPGIPPESCEKLFDMFYRASNKSDGTGLGLYIVKNSLEKIGGQVELLSEVGLGSEFIISFPISN